MDVVHECAKCIVSTSSPLFIAKLGAGLTVTVLYSLTHPLSFRIPMAQRILVVDDDRQIVRLVRAYLEQADYNVIVAYDGDGEMIGEPWTYEP